MKNSSSRAALAVLLLVFVADPARAQVGGTQQSEAAKPAQPAQPTQSSPSTSNTGQAGSAAPTAPAPPSQSASPGAFGNGAPIQLPTIVVQSKRKQAPAKPAAQPAASAGSDTTRPETGAANAPASAPPVPITATPDATLSADLAAAPAGAASVFAVASPGQTIGLGANAGTITSVSPATIAATAGGTITDPLQDKPGITGSTFAPGANRPIIRGLDNNRVRVQENGVSTGDVSDLSEDHAVPVNPCAADAVEVARGPAILTSTSKAVGGLVSLDNQRVPTKVPEGGVSGEIRGGVNTVDNGRDGCFKAIAGAKGFVIYADGFARDTDDYKIPGGRQSNSFGRAEGSSFGGSYVWDRGYAGIAFTRYTSLYAIPGGESSEAKSRIDLIQDKLVSKAEWRPGEAGVAAIRLLYGYTDYSHNELALDSALGEDTIASRFTNRLNEGRIEVEHVPVWTGLGVLRGRVGVQFAERRLTGRSFEGDSLLEPNITRSKAVFASEELAVTDRLRVIGSLRIEDSRVRGASRSDPTDPLTDTIQRERTFTPISAGLGLTYDLPHGLVGRAHVMHVERSPEAQELFSQGAHEATATFELGNPGLRLENAWTAEIGLKRDRGRLRFDGALFHTRYDGFIFRQFTGDTCDATLASCGPGGGDLRKVLFGQSDATFYGFETTGEYDVAEIWRGTFGVSARYDFTRARFENGGNVPRIPPHRLGSGLYYRDGAWRISITALHAFRQDEIAINETLTKGYTLVGTEITYTTRLSPGGTAGPELTIGLKGDNLLDDDVRNHSSFKKDEVLQPGRNGRLFGILRF